jgi:hypothetical protein
MAFPKNGWLLIGWYRKQVAELVDKIEAEARANRQPGEAVRPLEVKHPHERPARLKKAPAPRFHAASRDMRKHLYELYKEFVGLFRVAAEKLKSGNRLAIFPPGSFPPRLPFASA